MAAKISSPLVRLPIPKPTTHMPHSAPCSILSFYLPNVAAIYKSTNTTIQQGLDLTINNIHFKGENTHPVVCQQTDWEMLPSGDLLGRVSRSLSNITPVHDIFSKKGWLRASRAVIRSEGSNFSNPCNKSISKNLEAPTTCCDTRFCISQIVHQKLIWGQNELLRIVVEGITNILLGLINGKEEQERAAVKTLRWSILFTALILSLEIAPSGQFRRDPRLKYFSAPRLQKMSQ